MASGNPGIRHPEAIRRDSAPHRGRLLQTAATVGLVLAVLSFLLFPGVLSVPLCICVLVAAQKDLRAMRTGMMDAQGRLETQTGRDLSIAALVVAAMYVPMGVLILVASF